MKVNIQCDASGLVVKIEEVIKCVHELERLGFVITPPSVEAFIKALVQNPITYTIDELKQ